MKKHERWKTPALGTRSMVYCNVAPKPHPVAVINGRCVSCGQPVKVAT